MQILDIKENDNILIVAPHPDDECIGAGGLLAYYPGLCKVIVLTDGRQGQGDVQPEIEKIIREKEFAQEMKAVGIEDYQMLDYEDGTLMEHTNCLESINISTFTKIFVTGIHDNHADHTAACLSVFQALHKQNIRDVEIYLYEVHSPLQNATHLLDITEVMEKKCDFIRFHKSQLKCMPYDRMAEYMAAYRAIQNRISGLYAEVYTRMTPADSLVDSSAELERQLQKQILFYWILTRWLEIKINGGNTAQILQSFGYRRIAVYGYAELGKLLCRELTGTEIQTEYVLDKKVSETEKNLPIYVPQKGLPQVDAVVVTAVYYFEEIKAELLKLGFGNVISFRHLLEKSTF